MIATFQGCRVNGCQEVAAILVSGTGSRGQQVVDWPVCRSHAWAYTRPRPDLDLSIQVIAPGLAVCPRCHRLVARNGQARHGFTADGWQAPCEEVSA